MGRPATASLLLVLAWASGCAPRLPIAAPPTSGFSCAGPLPAEPPAPHPYPAFRYDPSRLTVRREAETITVVARGVPLGAVLAEAAGGESVLVHPDIVFAPIALQVRAVSFDTLLSRLAHELDLEVHVDGDHRTIEPRLRAEARRRRARLARLAEIQSGTIEMRLLPVAPDLAAPLAETYCRQIATARGQASVVGRYLVVRDTVSALDRLEEVLRAMDEFVAPADRRSSDPVR